MKKKITALCTAVITALSCSACSDTAAEPDRPLGENEVYMKGLCGEQIYAVDFMAEHSDDELGSLELPFSVYTYEGFGYYSPSDGKVVAISNCDPYSAGELFDSPVNYRHINVGDKIGDLTLESASGMLFLEDGDISLEQQALKFSGKLTLKGYVYVCKGDEMYAEEGNVWFYPADGEWKGLPYQRIQCDFGVLGENCDFCWLGDAPMIRLGSVSDYEFSELAEYSSDVREVTVTINEITLRNCFTDLFFGAGYYMNFATLLDIKE
ncbi:MAG: hypothetical protein NC203_04915 [Firmicutes bacterium]|nr:hypothetical protein [[Eubacterium] siraeum]MCM1487691.1 hypothetical protein [Bacillota bacterium]